MLMMLFKVVFCGRNEEAGSSIAAENDCTFIKCDVTVSEQVESFFKQVSKLNRLKYGTSIRNVA